MSNRLVLSDWPPIEFTEYVLAQHPAPTNSETGMPLWESGIRLHGAQRTIMESPYRFKQLTGGIRAGKSFEVAIAVYIDWLWRQDQGFRDELYWLVGPDYEQTREEMRHLHRLFNEGGIIHNFSPPKDGPWAITFPDCTSEILTKSSKDETTIAGRAPRGIAMTEASQQQEGAKEACIERVTQTRGWLLISGTFEKANAWFYDLVDEWGDDNLDDKKCIGVSLPLPTWDNVVEFPGGRTDPKILEAELALSPTRFMERYGGVKTKNTRLKMPQANRRYHIRHRYPHLGISYDPEIPVMLAIDPGGAHAYAVMAFQLWGNLLWGIDAVYRWGRETYQIIDEVLERPWAENVDFAVMDIAGQQVRSEGRPNVDQWRDRWLRKTGRALTVFTNRVPLQVGYDLHQRALLNSWPEEEAQRAFNDDKRMLKVTDPTGPRLMFSPEAAIPLFGGYVDQRSYRGEYNLHVNRQRPDGSIPTDDPIDENNDAIKAISYLLFHLYRGQSTMRFGSAGGGSMKWEVTV